MTNTAMIAKRFLDGDEIKGGEGQGSESGDDDGNDVYYFYEMDDDDMSLYDKFARRSFWIPDSSSQSSEPQGPVQKDQSEGNQSPNAVLSFPKPPLPSNHTGVVPPKPGMGPDGKPLLPTLHADNMPFKVQLFSIASIVIMGLINICFKQGGKWASNILAIFKIAGMMVLIGIGIAQAIKTHNQSETLKIPLRQCSHNILDYISALCYAFFAVSLFFPDEYPILKVNCSLPSLPLHFRSVT